MNFPLFHDVNPAIEEGGREEVPEQVEVERDQGSG
jgi:hypothetical protein